MGRIKKYLPAERKPQGGRPAKDNRMMPNAIIFWLNTGIAWRDSPERFGSWNTVYTRFRRWSQSVGKSKGDLSTKVHAVCDGLGNPLRFFLTGGQVHGVKVAIELLGSLDLQDKVVLCDKGYDSTSLVNYIYSIPMIPTCSNSKNPRNVDSDEYKERHLIENLFLKMKNCRRFSTRCEKSALSFSAVTLLSAILIWLLW